MNTTYPQKLVTFYKLESPDIQRGVWANYDKNGNFINLTNYYGKELILLEQDRVNIDGKIWVCKESFR
ncbi:hypothetical protein F994_02376 [Acinetobacter bohemicus ANC 3994]|jgi:hypothetical protein|uniref:Uncharacterized protein n=3 Tax=Acinetobacter TaxID=469 RepID=A0A1H3IHL1_9GAMM|nr:MULTISPECIES: hypothetical protein [Acinetobacter]ENU19516.1 hypothetical protein F994_02376 [Acinetobacter bohemicus ANC 3994]KAB0650847.1 hypothetical protein F7P73_15365 [Acinetobacter bohemicus]SDY27141.1 hypothetical protein SAMN05421643_106160 [Acinetobacter kyonggiensis]SFT18364.1 hypothetical protein SAMN05444586_103514 [Acinetobacter bohemicus]